MIWAFASPEPAFVAQVKSRKVGRRYHQLREIPAVLHTCRESRNEFLETDDPNDISLQRRRLAHPVYKLHFREGSTRNGLRGRFMSSDTDTFWPLEIDTIGHAFANHFVNPSLSPVLRHLTITRCSLDEWELKSLIDKVPTLGTLTFALSASYYSRFGSLLPEINGELNINGFPTVWQNHLQSYRSKFNTLLKKMAPKYPKLNTLKVKWRFQDQIIANEGIKLLPPPEEDPFKELDREMNRISRRKIKEKRERKQAKDRSSL
ncbi:uncharacterized protein LY89DRAFT_687579 [Mollisia scopiformis]|uniref:Uncharacterized protein n=1 Tax=Mollisia scopiformis TaxID=149040 RepID=A0A194X0M5_MOLSC|nr:uncharacterized protein LY89DRAFT_687579 [Mollisia scopiformis]KUJ13509.1 hypothetical protein LY89DRAFT_687579 [Mollisia scopiformis]